MNSMLRQNPSLSLPSPKVVYAYKADQIPSIKVIIKENMKNNIFVIFMYLDFLSTSYSFIVCRN